MNLHEVVRVHILMSLAWLRAAIEVANNNKAPGQVRCATNELENEQGDDKTFGKTYKTKQQQKYWINSATAIATGHADFGALRVVVMRAAIGHAVVRKRRNTTHH